MINLFSHLLKLVLSVGLCVFTTTAFTATLSTGKDERSLLPYWEIVDEGMSLRLVHRLPDQIRAFFLSRNFSEEHVETIATSCAFQTVLTNTSHKSTPGPLNFNLRKWVVLYKGQQLGLKTREDWNKEWSDKKVAAMSKMAFEWSLVPTEMEYQPNDYNWGISFFDLKPGTVFDLKVVWRQHDKKHSVVIKDIQCAPDIHPDPEEFLSQ